MFDPQNGLEVEVKDILSLRLRWGRDKDSPVIPIFIRGEKN